MEQESQPAGEEVRVEAARGRARGEEMENHRRPRGGRRRSPGARPRTARPARAAPALTWGLQLRILCPPRVFLPAPPGDFSAPESRSLGQVPPAASSPRGTPGATPLTAYHWLESTPVTFPLAED